MILTRFSRLALEVRITKRLRFTSASLVPAVAASLAALASGTAAHAQFVYTAGSGAQFGTINVLTGAFTPIGTGFTTYSGTNTILSGVAYAANGNLYGLDYTNRFFQVNTTTGALTLIGTVSAFGTSRYESIGNTSDGTLYAFYNTSGTAAPSIYTINPTTAVATLLGSSGSTFFDGGISGDGSGNLFATAGDGTGSPDYKINRTTGAATVLSSSSSAPSVYALGYTNSNLYGFSSTGNIYTYNTTTGAATNTGVTYNTTTAGQSQGVAPLIFTPTGGAAPEPGSVALLALAGLPAVGMIVRRRRSVIAV